MLIGNPFWYSQLKEIQLFLKGLLDQSSLRRLTGSEGVKRQIKLFENQITHSISVFQVKKTGLFVFDH